MTVSRRYRINFRTISPQAINPQRHVEAKMFLSSIPWWGDKAKGVHDFLLYAVHSVIWTAGGRGSRHGGVARYRKGSADDYVYI